LISDVEYDWGYPEPVGLNTATLPPAFLHSPPPHLEKKELSRAIEEMQYRGIGSRNVIEVVGEREKPGGKVGEFVWGQIHHVLAPRYFRSPNPALTLTSRNRFPLISLPLHFGKAKQQQECFFFGYILLPPRSRLS
jgi:hypothetical protein